MCVKTLNNGDININRNNITDMTNKDLPITSLFSYKLSVKFKLILKPPKSLNYIYIKEDI